MPLDHPVLFEALGVSITQTVVTSSAMVAVLCVLGVFAGRRVRREPSRWQALAEWSIRAVQDMLAELAGPDGRRYLPLIATLAIYILVANMLGVLPGVQAPTADLNTTAALAVIVFFSVHYAGIRQAGLFGYLARFAQPTPILLPINILSQLTRTLSMAIRLFGNVMSHQIIVSIVLLIVPVVVPALLEIFGLAIGVLQAYIFTLLAMVYIGGAVRAGGEL